jgi:DNA-binding transcriptional MerR regulator
MYITGDFKVAKVKFLSGNNTNTEYEYALFDDLMVGDIVVVSAANNGFSIAKISAIIDKDDAQVKKFEREVVARVDLFNWEMRVEKRKRMQELNGKMEKRAQELNKLAVFEMLAEKDPSLKSMLDEYKELVGG